MPICGVDAKSETSGTKDSKSLARAEFQRWHARQPKQQEDQQSLGDLVNDERQDALRDEKQCTKSRFPEETQKAHEKGSDQHNRDDQQNSPLEEVRDTVVVKKRGDAGVILELDIIHIGFPRMRSLRLEALSEA